MDEQKAFSIPLMKVAPKFFKEKNYWESRLLPDEEFRDVASVDYIDYNPHDLDELLVSSIARVSIVDGNSLELKQTFKTNSQLQVYGGCFRKNDGRLVAVGSEEGKVFVFESQNPSPLRVVNLKAATRRVLFMENNLVTFSDDMAVRLIDVGSGTTIKTYGGDTDGNNGERSSFHKDYVRCGCLGQRFIASGSYDNSVKFWDPRIDHFKPVMEFDHGNVVESLCTRGETLLVSVGGNKLHVFDMVAGKTLTNIIPKHHKNITSVANHEDKYLLTGALDGYLNILDFNFEYVTRFSYDEAPILSIAVNPKLLAMGFNNHNVRVRRFKDFIRKSNNEMAELEKLQSGIFGPNMVTRYFHEAIAESQDPVATHRAMLAIKQKQTPVTLEDVKCQYEPLVIPRFRQKDLSRRPVYERLLAGFHHAQALEAALKTYKKDPDSVIFVLQELIKRDKLKTAYRGCSKLVSLMKFISMNLHDIRHGRMLLDCALILIDLILNDKSLIQQENLDYWSSVDGLRQEVGHELCVTNSCIQVAAQLSTVVSQY